MSRSADRSSTPKKPRPLPRLIWCCDGGAQFVRLDPAITSLRQFADGHLFREDAYKTFPELKRNPRGP